MTVRLPEGVGTIVEIDEPYLWAQWTEANELTKRGYPKRRYRIESLDPVELLSSPTPETQAEAGTSLGGCSIEDTHNRGNPVLMEEFKRLTDSGLIAPAYCWLLAAHSDEVGAQLDGLTAIIGGGRLWSAPAMVDFAVAFGLTVEPPAEHTQSLIIGTEGWEGR